LLRAPDSAGPTSTAIPARVAAKAAAIFPPALSLHDALPIAYTSSTAVTLTLAATDAVGVTGYYLATSATPPAASAAGWTTVTSSTSYTGSLSYALSAGDGTNTPYTQSMAATGYRSTIAATTNLLDQTAPSNGSAA